MKCTQKVSERKGVFFPTGCSVHGGGPPCLSFPLNAKQLALYAVQKTENSKKVAIPLHISENYCTFAN